jgi:hypothetical protein
MMRLGLKRDRSHPHTRLEGAFAHAEALAGAKEWLRLLRRGLPVQAQHPHYTSVSQVSLARAWPNTPLAHLTGDLELEKNKPANTQIALMYNQTDEK